MRFTSAATLRDSPGTRQVTVERHEGKSATGSSSGLGRDALPVSPQHQEILDAWVDAEGEIPASRLWR